MPGRDYSGPVGEGPRTGRGMGDCPGGAASDWWPRRGMGMAWGPGRGRGFGFRPRLGMGWRRGWRSAPGPWSSPEQAEALELDDLQAQASWLQQGLDDIRARIDELRGSGNPEQE